ncbi:MAG: DUF503 domain-containing protein [Candidatus Eisenbacteria bacterium]|nr:DUF503 domain-containing protein [Candidatus Eisenbacteria bacterium]
MTVVTLEVVLLIRESHSLKSRRRVLKSLKDRIRSRFNVSVADVGDQNLWQKAVLAVAVVSNDGRFANETLSKVFNLVASEPRVEIVSHSIEVR